MYVTCTLLLLFQWGIFLIFLISKIFEPLASEISSFTWFDLSSAMKASSPTNVAVFLANLIKLFFDWKNYSCHVKLVLFLKAMLNSEGRLICKTIQNSRQQGSCLYRERQYLNRFLINDHLSKAFRVTHLLYSLFLFSYERSSHGETLGGLFS